jgi:hypothetical protein
MPPEAAVVPPRAEVDPAYGRIARIGPKRARLLLVVTHALVIWGGFRLVWAFSDPGGNGPVLLDALTALVPGLFAWGAWSAYTMRRRRRPPGAGWIVPTLMALLTLFLVSNASLYARWAASESAFADEVRDFPNPMPVNGAVDDQMEIAVPSHLGAYEIDYAGRIPGGYIFRDVHGGMLDEAGFAWLPAGPPTLPGWTFAYIDGSWYTYVNSTA